MAKELVYRVRVTTDRKAFDDFRRSAVSGQKDVEKSIRNTTTELNRQIELLDLYRQKGDITSEELSQGFQDIENQLKDIPVATRDVIRSQRKLLKAQQAATGSTIDLDKATSNANQTLFSFGDIVNDAQQFQFGFAQGSRAIGNNIGFMAEQIANTSRRAGGFTGALRAMGQSLLGPGGLILGINLVVSALTLFGDKLFGGEDSVASKAEKAREEIEDLRKELDLFSPRLKALTDIQGDAFPDQSKLSALQQQVQFARQIESSLSNELDTETEQIEKLEKQVDLFDQIVSKELSANEAVKQGLISRELGVAILQGNVDLEGTLIQKRNQLNEATLRQAALEKAVQDAQEEQISTLSQIQSLEAAMSSELFRELVFLSGENFREQFKKQVLNDELLSDISDFNNDLSEAINKGVTFGGETDTSQRERELKQQLENFKTVKKAELELSRITSQRRVAIERAAIGAISTIRQQFAQNSKPFALALLAVEKGLAISNVLVDATQKAAQATAQGLLFASNPATAPLAAQAFSAAAAIKTNAAIAAGLIAGQGLAEGAGILSGGGGAGGPSAGGTPGARQRGFSSGEASGLHSDSSFGRPSRNLEELRSDFDRKITFNVTNKIDRKGAALFIRDGERELKTDLINK